MIVDGSEAEDEHSHNYGFLYLYSSFHGPDHPVWVYFEITVHVLLFKSLGLVKNVLYCI